MTRKRNKFLTFLFSLIPGCGQMYMGLMKRGFSLLVLFAGGLALVSLLSMEALAFLSAVVWCWAFFDALNLMHLDPEVLDAVEDDFVLFGSRSELPQLHISSTKLCHAAGVLLILIGAVTIWHCVFSYIYDGIFYYNEYIAELLYRLNYYIPRLAVSVLIIWAGVRLIRRKKTESAAPELTEPAETTEVSNDEAKD